MTTKPVTHHPTRYKSVKPESLSPLFFRRLKPLGFREYIHHELTTEKSRFLTNGKVLVWVTIGEDGRIFFSVDDDDKSSIKIVLAMLAAANSAIVSEHRPKYWGYETEEEWVDALKAKQRETEVVRQC